MNKERILSAIELMRNAQNLSMCFWQGDKVIKDEGRSNAITNICPSIEELHSCGNTACFAGYLAISQPFKDAGGRVQKHTGAPIFYSEGEGIDYEDADAVGVYLDIPYKTACSLVYGDLNRDPDCNRYRTFSEFYQKPWANVEAVDVIAKLEGLLSAGYVHVSFKA